MSSYCQARNKEFLNKLFPPPPPPLPPPSSFSSPTFTSLHLHSSTTLLEAFQKINLFSLTQSPSLCCLAEMLDHFVAFSCWQQAQSNLFFVFEEILLPLLKYLSLLLPFMHFHPFENFLCESCLGNISKSKSAGEQSRQPFSLAKQLLTQSFVAQCSFRTLELGSLVETLLLVVLLPLSVHSGETLGDVGIKSKT